MNDKFNIDEADIKKAKQTEEEEWRIAICLDTLESYRHYIDSYPQGLHITEAHHRIDDIRYEQKERVIRELCKDRNAYHLNYIKACGISVDDLRGKIKDSKGQVRDEVLRSWNKLPNSNGIYGQAPERIPIGAAEIYFWGVHGSGKTCILEAILSYAEQWGFIQFHGGYLPPYRPIFNVDYGFPAVALPKPTPNVSIQYMPLTLEDVLGKIHRLSIVDIPSEIFDCFRCELMGQPFKTKHHEETYKQLKKYLNNKDNPKYHFFILDSQNSEQKLDLQYAALYLRENNIFNETTLGINLIITKSDLLSSNRRQWLECAMHHVEHHYAFFANTLKRIIGSHRLGLTDRKLSVIPFSIGEIFFKDLCIFNPESAKVLVDLLMCYADEGEKEWRWRNKGIRLHSFLRNGMGGIIDECLDSIEKRGFSPKGKITMTRNYGFVLNGLGGQLVIEDDTEQHLIKFEPSAEIVSIAATFKDEICLTAGGQIFTSRKGEDSFLDSDLMLYPIQLGSLCFFESISAGEGHIVGVNYDGTVFCWDDWRSWESAPDFKSMVKGWRNIKQVAVGYGNILALTNDGKILGSDESFYKKYHDFIQVDAYGHYYGDSYSMALRSNGTVMSPNFEEVSAWHDIVQIAVGWDAAVGLRRDGGVNIVFYDDDVVKEVSSWTNIVNIECKFSQIIAISRKGRIYSIKIH